MKTEKEMNYLKAFRRAFELFQFISNAVLKKGGGDSDMDRLYTEPELADQIAALIVGAVAKFAVAVNFTLANTAVKFSYIGDNFKSWFYGKTEEAKDVVVPHPHHDLHKASLDCEILTDLGGEARAETTLAGIYELLKLQPNGQPGVLLTNGYANIFYVRDTNSVLRTVYVYWFGDGWDVLAVSVEIPDRWLAGNRVFSC